jgi:molecular chaperone HtpG
MEVEKEEPIPEEQRLKDQDGKPTGSAFRKVRKDEILNSRQALWTRPPQEVKEEEYTEFYKHLSHDWNEPLEHLHLKFEGRTEYTVLIYIPSKAPWDLLVRDRKYGLQLYSKRVFITDHYEELVPEYFSFVKGVVDAPDINLNVSREILQQDTIIRNIRRNLVKKIFSLLEGMEREKYEKFWREFGAVVKLGIHTDAEYRERLAGLLRFYSTKGEELRSLQDYLGDMPEDQKYIYYLTGDSLAVLRRSPHLERLRDKGWEVILFTDPVDEWVVQSLTEYAGKSLRSAEKGDLGLAEEKKSGEDSQVYAEFLKFVQEKLQDRVREVRASQRLKDSLSCLAGDEQDLSAHLEKLLKAMGQEVPEQKRVLELNMEHPVLKRLQQLHGETPDDPRLPDYCRLLLDLAEVAEGGRPEDPADFGRRVSELLSGAVGVPSVKAEGDGKGDQ